MPLHRRIYQFLIIYFLGLSGLMLIKYSVGLSDYVIPGPADVWETWGTVWRRYMRDVVNTLLVAMVGQVISVFLAGLVGIFGRRATWLGQLSSKSLPTTSRRIPLLHWHPYCLSCWVTVFLPDC